MDCSFQSPAPFREQRAYREEYPVSWKLRFASMTGDWFGETAWGSLKKVSFIEESFLRKVSSIKEISYDFSSFIKENVVSLHPD